MRTNPITDRENRTFSVPKAAAVGAALGYVGTYVVPLTTEEHDKYITTSVKNAIANKAREARKSEIEIIKEEFKASAKFPLAQDVFEKSADVLEMNPKEALKNLQSQSGIDKSIKDQVAGLYKRVQNSGKVTKIVEEAKTGLAAKKASRAVIYYMGVGALALMSMAVLRNTFISMLPKKPKEPETVVPPTMADYLINSSNTTGEIYIYSKGLERQKQHN